MGRTTTLADIDRAHALFSNHAALRILDTLGCGQDLHDLARDIGQETISDAVALLDKMGLVDPGPGTTMPPARHAMRLTRRGEALVQLLEEISNDPT